MYCTKCGTQNEDDAKVCTKCGASLKLSHPGRRPRSGDNCFGSRESRPMNKECFGLPYGGAIVGLIFGLIVVIIGLAVLTGFEIWSYLWAVIIVIVGVLVIAGALYGMRR